MAGDDGADTDKLLALVDATKATGEASRINPRTTNKKQDAVLDAGSHDPADVQRRAGTRHDPSLPPKFYTIPDVAELLKVSTKTIRRWIDDGELAVHRFNRRIRISESDLSDFIRRRRGT